MSLPKATNTFAAKNLGGGSLVELANYTAGGDQVLLVDIRFDALSGNDEYDVRITRTPAGGTERDYMGSAFSVRDTLVSAGRHVISPLLFVENGDVIRVKAKNLSNAGDAAVAGLVTWVNASPLQPTVAGRMLDVAPGGEAGLDFANAVGTHPDVNLTAAALSAIGSLNVGSTATGMTLAKALEVLVAMLAGVASYDAAAGVWTVKGRDDATTIAEVTLAGSGNRPAITIH